MKIKLKINRKSVRKTDEHWQLTLSYCKSEFSLATTSLIILTITLTLALTISLFFKINDLQLPFYFYIVPMQIDEISISWLVNYLFQFFTTFPTWCFVSLNYAFTLVMINHTCWEIDATILFVKKLNETIQDYTPKLAQTRTRVQEQLKRTVDMTVQINEWQSEIQDVMEFNFLTEFYVMSFLICMALFSFLSNSIESFIVPAGIGLAFAQLFVYCLMGSLIEKRIEKLTAALYDTDWYLMDLKLQKQFMLILVSVQNMKCFDDICQAVNLESFQEVRSKCKFQARNVLIIY